MNMTDVEYELNELNCIEYEVLIAITILLQLQITNTNPEWASVLREARCLIQ